ncbi:growth-regulating factor 2 isoform X2 [Senna tora]|uniref:Growth-regulating factor n=1 Tax=Senna tora TaxID=362788 RepID=A0A834WSP7_9FABA|nr:growth-regulating factor 2 isoform X2 [Senna tora]
MMMKMLHHNHHHRPLLSPPFDNDSCGDGDGPTTSMRSSMTHPPHAPLPPPPHHHNNHNINDVVSGGSASPALAVGAAVTTLQPFDISIRPPAFKSPGAMAASLGVPFTNAQWRELERQAMIYKYMVASLPVPPALLIPTFTPASSRPPLNSGFNLRLSSSSNDPEPGRCRRTDGKKWRCSRDVAPNHKYCERHMHRGRPRSRKPVEVQPNTNTNTPNNDNNNNQQIKRARQDYHHQNNSNPFPTSGVTVAPNGSNPTIRNGGSSSYQFLPSTTTTQLYQESSSLKTTSFEHLPSVPPDSEPRGLEWMLKGDPISSMTGSDPEWQPLMQSKVGSPNYEDTLYLNSYASLNSGLDQHNRRFPLFLNPLVEDTQKPRGFIDAWSNSGNNNSANANKGSVSSNGKLSLSSLDLSMGGSGGGVDEEMGTIQMGLGLMEPDDGSKDNGTKTHLANWLTPASWLTSTPGGPLAEVLRPSTVAAAIDTASGPPSPVVSKAEMVSSPSGVLQTTLASLSDSSSNSSPTVASSKANSEVALFWFNKAN